MKVQKFISAYVDDQYDVSKHFEEVEINDAMPFLDEHCKDTPQDYSKADEQLYCVSFMKALLSPDQLHPDLGMWEKHPTWSGHEAFCLLFDIKPSTEVNPEGAADDLYQLMIKLPHKSPHDWYTWAKSAQLPVARLQNAKLEPLAKSVNEKRMQQCLNWIAEENPDVQALTKEQIRQALSHRATNLHLENVWTGGFEDWWRGQKIIPKQRGTRKRIS